VVKEMAKGIDCPEWPSKGILAHASGTNPMHLEKYSHCTGKKNIESSEPNLR
jgi:hypothetical protein